MMTERSSTHFNYSKYFVSKKFLLNEKQKKTVE